MKQTFINEITEMMESHEDTITLTADMGFSVFEELQKKFPQRFMNTGVTEQATVSIAAGLALSGYKVFFYAQAAFATMRCFEQLHIDVAYSNLNIKVIGVNAGVSLNQLGVSHFSLEDVGIVRTLPNMTIFTPANAYEMKWAMQESYKINGPTYLRYSKLEDVSEREYPLNRNQPAKIMNGTNAILLVSGGIMKIAKQAIELLKKENISVALYSVHTVKPLDTKQILKICSKSNVVFTLEEHSIIGGLGSAVSEILAESVNSPKLQRLGVKDEFISVTGSAEYLLGLSDLTPTKIALAIKKAIK